MEQLFYSVITISNTNSEDYEDYIGMSITVNSNNLAQMIVNIHFV
jgi:hypothetical protein